MRRIVLVIVLGLLYHSVAFSQKVSIDMFKLIKKVCDPPDSTYDLKMGKFRTRTLEEFETTSGIEFSHKEQKYLLVHYDGKIPLLNKVSTHKKYPYRVFEDPLKLGRVLNRWNKKIRKKAIEEEANLNSYPYTEILRIEIISQTENALKLSCRFYDQADDLRSYLWMNNVIFIGWAYYIYMEYDSTQKQWIPKRREPIGTK
jgi:hypothetical protein